MKTNSTSTSLPTLGHSGIKSALSDSFDFILKFWYFGIRKEAHIFLITHVKFYSWNMCCLEDILIVVTATKLAQKEKVTAADKIHTSKWFNCSLKHKLLWWLFFKQNITLQFEKSDHALLKVIAYQILKVVKYIVTSFKKKIDVHI